MVKLEMNLSFQDLEKAIKRLPVKLRVKIVDHLLKDQDTWREEFRELRNRIRERARKNPVSPKEITAIVEEVRQDLYDRRHR